MEINIRRIKLLTPLIFWLFQLLVHIIRNIYLIIEESFGAIFQNIQVTYPLDIITFCVFYFVFATQFYKKEKVAQNLILSIVFIILYSGVWFLVFFLLTKEYNYSLAIGLSSIGHSLLYAFYGIICRIAIDWFQRREEQKELEKQNITTELALLRSQVNPHFLFNSLNNINSFVTKNPDKTSYAIIKLSEIMRYMLYEAKEEQVLLTKEINYIQNYLELQKIRYENKEFVAFELGEIPLNILVPPMLFIPFIENAFKHGRKNEKNKIQISLLYEENILSFTCVNSKRKLSESENSAPKGIGIENIKRRLQLLYPNCHSLEIEDSKEKYKVYLNIDII